MSPYSYVKEKVYVKLQPSRLQGVGVFAIKDIPANTLLFEPWKGETKEYKFTEEELRTLPNALYRHIKDIFLYSPDFPNNTDTYIKLTKGCHWVYTTPYYFMNSNIKLFNVDKDTLKSTRLIKKGQELLSNYGRYEKFKDKQLL